MCVKMLKYIMSNTRIERYIQDVSCPYHGQSYTSTLLATNPSLCCWNLTAQCQNIFQSTGGSKLCPSGYLLHSHFEPHPQIPSLSPKPIHFSCTPAGNSLHH
uniref:Uncharacterized protein n=1 Tax=Micrurus spixii TaxID=129469 RepID=A0A2D4MV64_9SAUR